MSEKKAEPYARTTKAWVLLLASTASLMAALDTMVITTALSTIHVDLGASIEALEWAVNAYTYTLIFAVLLLTGAALGDRLGRRAFSSGFAAEIGVAAFLSLAAAMAALPMPEARSDQPAADPPSPFKEASNQ
jgi:MFS family permease